MKKIRGIDIGYGTVKVVGDAGELAYPSVVGNYEEQAIRLEGFTTSAQQSVVVDGERYLIGESAIKYSTNFLNGRSQDWIKSKGYRALLSAALQATDPTAGELVVVSGLPVNYYKSDREVLESLIEKVAGQYAYKVRVRVLPQPLGAFCGLMFDEEGAVGNEGLAAAKVGIVDIGYYTTDFVTVDRAEIVEKQMDSFETGVSSAWDGIIKDVRDRHNHSVPLKDVESVVRHGYIKLYGEKFDVTEIIQKRLQVLAYDIQSKAKTLWKSAADLDVVYLSGGGAEILRNYLKPFPHTQIIENAQFANAQGYYRYGVRRASRE